MSLIKLTESQLVDMIENIINEVSKKSKKQEKFDKVWECACGEGHLAKILEEKGILHLASDLIDRGYGDVFDFLSTENKEWEGDIITNPPYSLAKDFIEKALQIIPQGNKIEMFLKIKFL